MGRPDHPRFGTPHPLAGGTTKPTARGTTQPSTHETARRPRGDRRLDPVRRRRPSRGTLLRLAAAVVLLAAAAVASWSPAGICGVQPSSAAASLSPSSAAASLSPSSAAAGVPASSLAATGAAPPGGVGAGGAGVIPPGSVGVPIRLADPTALSLVHPGNRVDLLRLDETDDPTAIAAAALVLRVTGAGDPTTGGLLLALSPAEAARAVAQPGHGFAILIRPG